jgi:hypothetical protein
MSKKWAAFAAVIKEMELGERSVEAVSEADSMYCFGKNTWSAKE